MTQRSAFVLQVRPERIDEYIEAHRVVWPGVTRVATLAPSTWIS